MIGNSYMSDKVKEMIELANMSEEEVEKLDHKAKQKYYRAKSKLGTMIHKSRDKNGKGITYRKKKEQ